MPTIKMNIRTESCKWYKEGSYNPENERIRCRNPDVSEHAPPTTVCDECEFHETNYKSRNPQGDTINISNIGMLAFDLVQASDTSVNTEEIFVSPKKRKIGETVQLETLADLLRRNDEDKRNAKRSHV